MAANRNEQLAKELGYQWSLKSWVEYDDSLLSKPQDQLTGYDKATLNVNPDLKAKREAYQASLVRSNRLQSDLNNIQNAQQFLQNSVSQQKDRINKLYDLQDKAAAISASIQWTNRVAGWLWAASNVLGNSRWITDAQMQQQILQNDAQRESALSNVAQQEANIPSVLASLDQANANSELARAQANYYNNQATKSYWWWGWWWNKWWNKWWDDEDEDINIANYEMKNWETFWNWKYKVVDWMIIDKNWVVLWKWPIYKVTDDDWNTYVVDKDLNIIEWQWQINSKWKWWNLDKKTNYLESKWKKWDTWQYFSFTYEWAPTLTLWTWDQLWTKKGLENIWVKDSSKRISL